MSSGTAVRVLVVEDGSVSARTLRMQLENLGYDVVGVFASGEEAVQSVQAMKRDVQACGGFGVGEHVSGLPDILLVDISLAGSMDGVEVVEHVRRVHDVPVIYLTAATDDATFQRAKETNPFAWLAKPVTPDSLHRSIGMALYKRELDAQLRRNEEKYRGIVQTMSEGLVLLDTDLHIVFSNASFLAMAGGEYSGVMAPLLFESLLCDATRRDFFMTLAKVRSGGRGGLAGNILRAGGGSVPVRISMTMWGDLSAADDADRAGCGIICVITDRTEQLASASALREVESKYRTLFENALDGIYQSTPEGRFLEVNPAMAAIFGYDSPSAMVELVRDIGTQMYVDAGDRKIFLQALWENEQVSRFQVRMKRRSGERIWVELSSRAVWGADGAISHIEGMLFDVTDRKKVEMDLRRRASRDDLTGLYNRHYFREWLNGALASAFRNGTRLALLYIDLNGFKNVNDTYGHLEGDRVLRELAVRIRDRVRDCDMVARIGGDEFCVVLEGLSGADDARRVAHEIGEALVQPLSGNGPVHSISGSVGIAVFPDDGGDVDSLLHCADEAMYCAKTDASSVFAFWSRKGEARKA